MLITDHFYFKLNNQGKIIRVYLDLFNKLVNSTEILISKKACSENLSPDEWSLFDWEPLSPFRKRVIQSLTLIPKGRVCSYQDLALISGNKKAVRAAGSAIAKNPYPLFFPCHRVVHKDGSISNFSAPGGITAKCKLLTYEGIKLDNNKIPKAFFLSPPEINDLAKVFTC